MPLTNKERIQIGVIAIVLILGILRVINLFTRRVIPTQGGYVSSESLRGANSPEAIRLRRIASLRSQ